MTESESDKMNPGKDTQEPDKHKDVNKKPVLFIVISMVLSILATVFTILYLQFWYVPYDKAEATKIREKVIEKWDAANAIPVQDNGWYQYEQAISLFKASLTGKEQEKLDDIVINGLKSGDLAFVESLEKKNKKVLSLVDDGYSMPEFRIPMDYAGGNFQTSPPIHVFTNKFIGFMCVLGEYEKEKGNNAKAARRYLQLLYLGQGAGRNGATINFFSGTGVERRALEHLSELMNDTNEDAQFYKTVLQEMERIDKERPTLAEILEFQIATLEITKDEISQAGANSPPLSSYQLSWPRCLEKEVVIRDLKAINQYLLELRQVANNDYQKIDVFIQRSSSSWIFALGTGGISEDMQATLYRYTDTLVAYDGVKLLAALRWYRKEKGEYPDDLTALTPGYMKTLPTDKFAGKKSYI